MKKSERTAKYRNYHKPWSKSDIKTLRRLYPHTPENQLARMLGRTPFGISGMADRLGLKKKYDDEFKSNRPLELRRWSDREIRILKKMYPSHTAVEISDSIDRTAGAITTEAYLLKLKKMWPWTKKEYDYLRRFHKKKPHAELSQILGRTVATIRGRAKNLGIARETPRWTKRQVKLLIEHYPTMQAKKLAKRIGRSARGLNSKARDLGIRRYAEDRRWTKQKDEILRKYYKKMPYKELAIKLGRTHRSVIDRVGTLGLVGSNIWTKKDIQVLKNEFKKGTKVHKIAKLLGKKVKTCYYKIKAIGLRRS